MTSVRPGQSLAHAPRGETRSAATARTAALRRRGPDGARVALAPALRLFRLHVVTRCDGVTSTLRAGHMNSPPSGAAATGRRRRTSEEPLMRRSLIFTCALASCLGLAVLVARPTADSSDADFGLFISDQLREHSQQLFGFSRPLAESARGPYDGADHTKAIQVAHLSRIGHIRAREHPASSRQRCSGQHESRILAEDLWLQGEEG